MGVGDNARHVAMGLRDDRRPNARRAPNSARHRHGASGSPRPMPGLSSSGRPHDGRRGPAADGGCAPLPQCSPGLGTGSHIQRRTLSDATQAALGLGDPSASGLYSIPGTRVASAASRATGSLISRNPRGAMGLDRILPGIQAAQVGDQLSTLVIAQNGHRHARMPTRSTFLGRPQRR